MRKLLLAAGALLALAAGAAHATTVSDAKGDFLAGYTGPKLDDLDLGLDEFVAKVNGDLVGKIVNLASRTARFVADSGLATNYPSDGGLFAEFAASGSFVSTVRLNQ